MTDPAPKTSLRKRLGGSPASAGASDSTSSSVAVPKSMPRPRTIDLACLALALVPVFAIANAVAMQGSTSTLKKYLTDLNAKKPVKNFDVDKSLDQLRHGALVQSLLFVVVFGLLIWAIRRTRSASGSRWAMLVVFLFTQLPSYVIPISGLPVLARVTSVLIGVAAVAALLLVFVPAPSRAYFTACRQASMPPERRAAAGAARPGGLGGLSGLFGPRRPAGTAADGAAPRGATRSAPTRPVPKDTATATATPRSRSKVRADTDATARGAELARARAKASKSRRSAG